MYTQVIVLGNTYYAIVFKLEKAGPQIIDRYSSEVSADLREWLSQKNYPMKGEVLRRRNGADLAHGYYIKPHLTDRYYRVHEDGNLEEVSANSFEVPLFAYDGF